MLFWNRDKGEKQYLHTCQYLEKEEGDEWEGQMASMIKKVTESGANNPAVVQDMQNKMDAIIDILTLSTRDNTLKFDEQKKRFDSISKVLQKRHIKQGESEE